MMSMRATYEWVRFDGQLMLLFGDWKSTLYLHWSNGDRTTSDQWHAFPENNKHIKMSNQALLSMSTNTHIQGNSSHRTYTKYGSFVIHYASVVYVHRTYNVIICCDRLLLLHVTVSLSVSGRGTMKIDIYIFRSTTNCCSRSVHLRGSRQQRGQPCTDGRSQPHESICRLTTETSDRLTLNWILDAGDAAIVTTFRRRSGPGQYRP